MKYQYRLTVIFPSGQISDRFQAAKPQLAQLQALVNGPIQIVPQWGSYEGKRCTVYANEEGLLRGLPYNQKATDLWRAWSAERGRGRHVGSLVGTVVIEQRYGA